MNRMSRLLALLLALVLALPVQILAIPVQAMAASPKSLEAEPLANAQENSGKISTQAETKELQHPTKREIAEKWAEVTTATSLYIEEPSVSAPYETGSLTENFLESGITYLNYVRFVAGLPAVTLDDSLNENAQYGAVLLAAVDYLTHRPSRPADMDSEFYELGYEATTSSNISARLGYEPLTCLQSSVHGCMDDSGDNNLSTVGHRRWLLNPTLGKVGFGYAEARSGWSYIVTKVFDGSGAGCSFDFISWPVAGNQPTNLFDVKNPWSVTLNSSVYRAPDASSVKITITRESDGKQWSFDYTTGLPYTNARPYMVVDYQWYGLPNCIIFHPGANNIDSYEGVFQVEITGIHYLDGSPAELNYEVDFFNISDVTDGHNYRAEVTEPTCTERGFTTYTCTDCGESYVGTYVDPLGHDYDGVVTHPTCDEGGYTTYTCDRCGDSYVGDRTPVLGHDHVKGMCERCGDGIVRLSLISAPTVTSYAVGDTVNLEGIVVAGYSENGDCIYLTDEDLTIVHCDMSSVGTTAVQVGIGDLTVPFAVYVHARRTDIVLDASIYPESDHNYANKANDWQTVTYPGATSLTLTFSDETNTEYGYDFIRVYDGDNNLVATYTGDDAAGVSLTVHGDTAKINLTSDGSYAYYGYSFSRITANTAEHTGKSTGSVDPTCTEPGFADAYRCEICDGYFGAQLIPALGHDYESVVTDATCDQDGYTTHTCRRCGDVTKDDFVDAYGHNYDNGVTYTEPTDTADGTMSTACGNCGRVASIVLANDVHAPAGSPFHDWEWEVLQITNSLRCNAGLQPLTGFKLLQDAAAIRAREIDTYFYHTRPDGRSCYTVFDDVGLDYYGAGENIAAGYYSPAYVMSGWMNSQGHRENILIGWFEHLGVGYEQLSRHDWTQMFLSGDGHSSCELVLPADTAYNAGTLVDEMGIYLLLDSNYYGECYLPMQSMYCEGYDPNRVGKQTVTYSVLGFTGSFEITIGGDDPCAGGHTAEVRGAEEATCTEPGYTGDTYCSVCGQLIAEGEVIPATGHSYDSAVTAPTCEEGGYTTYTCTNCDHSYVGDYTDPVDHSYADGFCIWCGEADVLASGKCGDNLNWVLTGDGTLTISGTGEMYDYKNFQDMPWYDYTVEIIHVRIEEGVTTIGRRAFQTCHWLTDVEIPDSVISIGTEAFGCCYDLCSVTIPKLVEYIGSRAFAYCSDLTEIRFLGNVRAMTDDMFEDVAATAYYPANFAGWTEEVLLDYGGEITWVPYEGVVEELGSGKCGDNLFWTMTDDGVLEIYGTGDMYDYEEESPWKVYQTRIIQLKLGEGVTTIGAKAFADCWELKEVTIHGGILSIGDRAFWCNYAMRNLTICEGVEAIEEGAFMSCISLSGVTIPDSVVYIGDLAFFGCSEPYSIEMNPNNAIPLASVSDQEQGLKKVYIGKGVEFVGEQAFGYCQQLKGIYVNSENPFYCNDDWGVLFDKEKETLIQAPGAISGEYSIPDGVAEIRNWAMASCPNLTAVTIPRSVEKIGDYAFSAHDQLYFDYKTVLEEIYFEGDAPEMGNKAFWDIVALAYYPEKNVTWTEDVMQDYGGIITWVGYTPECTDHTYEGVVTEPTCTEGGHTTYTCTNCGDSYVDDYVDALGHDYDAVVTEPTCEEGGYTTYTCTNCGDSYVDDYVDALGHDYDAVVTQPTCTEKGYTTHTCANCGDSYVSDYTDTVAHVYEDGYCKWCGEEVDAVRWDIGTASLNGTIDLVMYVFLSEELVNDPETFARFTFENRVVDVPIAQAEKTVQEDGTIRCRFSCPLFAKQLADAVDVQIMRGETPVGRTVKFSVMQYCQTMLQYSDNPKLHDMCKAMLNYGAAAQQIFDYNIDNLANAILSEEDKALPTPDLSAYKHSVSGSEAGIRPTIATLTLESEIRIRVYFKLDEGRSIDEYTFTVDGVEVQPGHNNNGWYIETAGIPAKRMEEMHEFKVGGLTVRYCALSYANQTISSAKPLEANMAKALYAYYAAAEAIFG